MPKTFEDLVKDLKGLKDTEAEAEKIVENAKKEAEEIIHESEEKAASVMAEIEEEVRRSAQEMSRKAEATIHSEVEQLGKTFALDIKELDNKVSKNMNDAVSYVLNQIVNTEGGRG